MFTSNQVKQEEYLKLRAQEEDNNRKHQRRLYKKLAQEQGEETTGTNLARLAERVAGKFGSTDGSLGKPGSTFGAILKKILGLTPKGLSEKAQLIVKNLNTPEWKKSFNDYMAEFLSDTKQAQPDLTPALTQALADEEAKRVIFGKNEDVLAELIDKINSQKEANEGVSMAAEDREIPSSTPATPAQIKALDEAQANLDLIALFQQDVKEARKNQALKDLAQLDADEDYRLRSKFMNVLEEMKAEAASKKATQKAKKEYAEQKLMIDKIMNLIENQRMHDSYLEFTKLAANDAFANKIQRNLKAALNYKKSMNTVNRYLQKERIMGIKPENGDMQRRNEAARTIRKKLIEVVATRRATQTPSSSRAATASLTTNAEPRPDLRQFNTGRPSEPLESKFNRITDILNIPVSHRSKKQKKTLSNLRGTTHNVKPIIELMEHL